MSVARKKVMSGAARLFLALSLTAMPLGNLQAQAPPSGPAVIENQTQVAFSIQNAKCLAGDGKWYNYTGWTINPGQRCTLLWNGKPIDARERDRDSP